MLCALVCFYYFLPSFLRNVAFVFIFSSGLEAYIRFQINSWFPLWFSKAYNFLCFFPPNCQSQEHLITLYCPVKEEFSYVYARMMAHPFTSACVLIFTKLWLKGHVLSNLIFLNFRQTWFFLKSAVQLWVYNKQNLKCRPVCYDSLHINADFD